MITCLSFLYDDCVHKNLPMVFLNWFPSMLITFEIDGWIFSKNTSLSWFDSYSLWICSSAACEWHQIQTTTVCLSSWELRISMPSSFSWLMSLSVSCDLGLVLFRRSSIFWWSSSVSIDVVHFAPRVCTSIFITAKSEKKYFKCQTTYSDVVLDNCSLIFFKYSLGRRYVTKTKFRLI